MSGKARKWVSIKTTKKMITQIEEAIEIIKSFHGNRCAVANSEIHEFLKEKIGVLNDLIKEYSHENKDIAEGFTRNLESAGDVNPETYDSGEVTISEEDKKKLEKLAAKEKKRREVAGETIQNGIEFLRKYLNTEISGWNEKIDGYVDTILNSEEKIIPFINKDREFIKKTLEDLCMEHVFEEIKNKNFDDSEKNEVLRNLIEAFFDNVDATLEISLNYSIQLISLQNIMPRTLTSNWDKIFSSNYWIPGDNKKDLRDFLEPWAKFEMKDTFGDILSAPTDEHMNFIVGGSLHPQGKELYTFYIELARMILNSMDFSKQEMGVNQLKKLKVRMEKEKNKTEHDENTILRHQFIHFVMWIIFQLAGIANSHELEAFFTDLLNYAAQIKTIMNYGLLRGGLFNDFKLDNLEWRQGDKILEQIRNRYSDSWLWNIAVKYAKTDEAFDLDSFLDTQIKNYLGDDRGYSDKFKTNLKMIIMLNGGGGDDVAKIAKKLFSGAVILYLLDDGDENRETIQGFINEKFKEIISTLDKKLKGFKKVFASVYQRGESPEFDTDFFIELYVYIHYIFDDELYGNFLLELDFPDDDYFMVELRGGDRDEINLHNLESVIKTLELLNRSTKNIFYRDEEVNIQDKKALEYCITQLMPNYKALQIGEDIENYVEEVDALVKINDIMPEIKMALRTRAAAAEAEDAADAADTAPTPSVPVGPDYEGPGNYRVIKKATVRAEPHGYGDKLGELNVGNIIEVDNAEESDDYLWLHYIGDQITGFPDGWVKFRTAGKFGFGRKQLLEFVSSI
tara:strand:- start:692 stop:3073 length:2382 start_codon:yes stop_codon:yes gene_type:complete